MCGIGGYVGPIRDVDTRALLTSLAARGPDGEGTVRSKGDSWLAVMVHRRLAIIDPTPAGAQPMLFGRTHALVFNGEIFNHAELRAELESEGCTFKSTSDTEVILQGMVRHGANFVEKLRGPFAIAFLDRRSGDVILARDRLGVNPLYVSEVPGGGIAFSSTVQALIDAGLTTGEVDVRGVCGFLFYGSVPEPLTLTRGVRELEPGCIMRVKRDGSSTITRYWRIPPEEPGLTLSDDVVQSVSDALKDAVAAEQVSDVPIALLLSSGLDSTAVAALVANTAKKAVDAFTISFNSEGPAVDEGDLAAETAKQLKLKHHRVHAKLEEGAQALRAAMLAQDLPSIDGINTYFVSRAIRNAGFKVALSGLGGDELFLGYKNRANFHRLASIPDLQNRIALGRFSTESVRRLGLSPRLERAVFAATQPRGRAGAYAAIRTIMGPATVLQLLHPDLRARVMPEDLDPVSYLDAEHLPRDLDGALSRLELRNYLRSTLLKDSNILSLANSLELRVPFMDWKLVDTLMRIPGRVRALGEGPKPLLRQGMGSLMPAGVEKRPKVGFVLPLQQWLEASGTSFSSTGMALIDPNARIPAFPITLAIAALQSWSGRASKSTEESPRKAA